MIISNKQIYERVEYILQHDASKCFKGTRREQLIKLVEENADIASGMMQTTLSLNQKKDHEYGSMFLTQAFSHYYVQKIYQTELHMDMISEELFRKRTCN